MAPFTPFLSEELYRKLTNGESVHLLDWPEVGHVNELLLGHMAAVREVITIGLSLRAEKGIKVRQPLQKVSLKWPSDGMSPQLQDIIKEELNVKEIAIDTAEADPSKTFVENLQEDNFQQQYRVDLDTKLTPELKREGLMREVIRQIQSARKAADLQVDDRITLELTTGDRELSEAIHEHLKTIKQETLATSASVHQGEDKALRVSVKKA